MAEMIRHESMQQAYRLLGKVGEAILPQTRSCRPAGSKHVNIALLG